ncbi:MAG: YWFCY domain-containing protein [Chitinophagaceae bacterium]
MAYILPGLLLYFIGYFFMRLQMEIESVAFVYIAITITGFILILTGGTLLSRIIRLKLNNSVFNSLNETFPQEERLLNNEYSINLPARYNLKGRIRKKAGSILLIRFVDC